MVYQKVFIVNNNNVSLFKLIFAIIIIFSVISNDKYNHLNRISKERN